MKGNRFFLVSSTSEDPYFGNYLITGQLNTVMAWGPDHELLFWIDTVFPVEPLFFDKHPVTCIIYLHLEPCIRAHVGGVDHMFGRKADINILFANKHLRRDIELDIERGEGTSWLNTSFCPPVNGRLAK